MKKRLKEAEHPRREVFQVQPICLPRAASVRMRRTSLRVPSMERKTGSREQQVGRINEISDYS